jgi:hypothetical protein
MSGELLRACAVCDKPVVAKPYQANSARACSPICAHILAVREHPELERRRFDEPSGGVL